ncbi:MAG: radical SAM protein [Clostridiales bacterium]|nr:radical SAM protein [Clostridiales bacterium]
MADHSTEKKTVVTDGQDLAEQVEDLKKNGVTDVTVVVNTFNYTKYKKSNEGKELQPVINGINKAEDAGMHITLHVGLKEGFNDDEVLDFLQLTLMYKYDIIFLPTMDYDKIKAKMPGLRKIEGDFGEVEMYKYAVAKGRIGFLKN